MSFFYSVRSRPICDQFSPKSYCTRVRETPTHPRRPASRVFPSGSRLPVYRHEYRNEGVRSGTERPARPAAARGGSTHGRQESKDCYVYSRVLLETVHTMEHAARYCTSILYRQITLTLTAKRTSGCTASSHIASPLVVPPASFCKSVLGIPCRASGSAAPDSRGGR